jgi:UDP-2,4-diacetamido-2,4,6-trideoxy-beta-L-altropyranose hydrolase
MRVAIRTDGSARIGLGHLQRCLSMARALEARGASVSFVVRDLGVDVRRVLGDRATLRLLPVPGVDAAPIQAADTPPHAAWAKVEWRRDALETAQMLAADPPDWVVVDHYAFDRRWHDDVRRRLGCRIAVIDDLADRNLAPDLLLDHNLHPDHAVKYRERLPAGTPCCFGPRFALLGPNYEAAPRYQVRNEVRSIGIFLGGTDPAQLSPTALDACRDGTGFTGPIEIASTGANPGLGALRDAAARIDGVTLTVDQADLAAFFARHDLQIGAGGGATWERCCIGAPTIGIVCADNQLHSMPHLHALGVLDMVETPGRTWDTVTAADIARTVARAIDEPPRRRQLSERSRALVDGHGAQRVAACMTKPEGSRECLAD